MKHFSQQTRSHFTVIFMTVVLFTHSSYAEISCLKSRLIEVFKGRLYEIDHIAVQVKDDKEISLSDLFPKGGTQLLLGIYPKGHIYLNVGGIRYDGQTFAYLGKVATQNFSLNDSFIIHFKDIPPETVQKIKDDLLRLSGSKLWTTSCYRATCNLLKENGVFLGGEGYPLLPSTLFERVLKNGFTDASGNPLLIEYYKTNAVSLSDISLAIRESETLIYLLSGGGILTAGSGLYLHFWLNEKKISHQPSGRK